MKARNIITIFITLISVTFFIFFSSIITSNLIDIDEKVDAETTGTNEGSSNINKHSDRVTKIEYKNSVSKNRQFFVTDESPYLYLTFDDGPSVHTERILNILEQYEVKATFFMLYGNINRLPEIVKTVSESGHSIGCHGVTHKLKAFYGSVNAPKKEMEACKKAVEKVTDVQVSLVRVPFGSYPYLTSVQKQQLDKANFIMWDWNVDSTDWNLRSSEKMAQHVINQVTTLKTKGKVPVILLHDTNIITVDALPTIIERLQGLGYQFKAIVPEDKPLQFKLNK